MPARNVNLTDHFVDFVEDNVASGRFQNASEVVREGLRLLERQQREDELKLEALRQAIDVGLRDAAEGRTISIESGEIGAYLRGLGQSAQA
jgi:antitoxin ParD1/3/4